MRIRSTLLVATLVASLSACAATGSGTADGDAADVAATVSGIEIPRSRVVALAEGQEGLLSDLEGEELADARAEVERSVLSAEIQLKAVEAAVEERFGLDIAEEDVDAALAENIEAQGGQAAFDTLAEEQGLTPEEGLSYAREGAYISVLVDFLRDALSDEEGVDDAYLQALYDEDTTAFQSSVASHILVATEAEAQDVLARLEAGEAFEDLAMELSTDPGSGANGGSLGEAPRGTYVQEFQDAIYAEDTVIGEVVGPVETQFGFHLIRVDAVTTLAFDDAREALEADVVNGLFTAFLEEVFADVTIEIDPYYGTWDPASRTVVAPVQADADADADAEGDADADAEG